MDVKRIELTWKDTEDLVEAIASKMISESWIPTCVIGLTRGGLLPGTMLSHYFRVPMCSLDVSLRDMDGTFGGQTTTWIPEEIGNGHRLLVVDDINDTGATFDWIRTDWGRTVQFLRPQTTDWPWSHIKFCSLVHNLSSTQPTDFHGMLIDKSKEPSWVVFPWESWFGSRI